MPAIALGQTSSVSNPVLSVHIIADGILVDPFLLTHTHYYAPTDADEEAASETGTVDLDADKLGTGWYADTFEVGVDIAVGRYRTDWSVTLEEDGPVTTFSTYFEVVEDLFAAGPAYATVWSMRNEGVRTTDISDAELHAKIVMASREFERYTGRVFSPAQKLVTLDGKDRRAVLFDEPIIGIESVRVASGEYGADFTTIENDDLRIYNRHLRQGLMSPDDRESPRIEYLSSAFSAGPYYGFPRGVQNVEVSGVFGYTDPDGTPAGGTPALVTRAVQLMVMKDLAQLSNTDERENAGKRWMLTGERTREQSYSTFSGVDAASRGAIIGGVTGDPVIDRLIVMYRRPIRLGAA